MVTLDEAGRARDWTRIIAPPIGLRPFVAFFWTQRAPPAVEPGSGWRIVPDAAPHIIVKRLHGSAGDPVSSGSTTRATLVGARSHHVNSDLPRRAWTAGVRLVPGTLPLLTGLPASVFTDRGATLGEALGSTGRGIERQLAEAPGPGAALAILKRMLQARLGRASLPDPRVAFLLRRAADGARDRRFSRAGVGLLADELGVPARTLRQRCTDDVGLPPVLILRIARLHDAVGLALAGTARGGWASIAARTGYFDQSHLIRDFQLLLGEPPVAFIRRSGR